MKIFNLPDLGEGLPDAEIVEWLVEEGDEVALDQPMVSMETAKAVVEVPSPYAGRIVKLHGKAGDVIQTGAPLCEFLVPGEAEDVPEPVSPEPETGHHDQPAGTADPLAGQTMPELAGLQPAANGQQDGYGTAASHSEQETEPSWNPQRRSSDAERELPVDEAEPASESSPSVTEHGSEQPAGQREDTGTVVGNVQSSNEVLSERTSLVGGVKVTPAVRAMARKLKVDISKVRASGADGVVTLRDVQNAAESGSANLDPATPGSTASTPPAPAPSAVASRPPQTQAPRPVATEPSGEWEAIRGPRRTMVRVMSESHRSVVPTSLMDDADIHAWRSGEDITARLLRSLWAGAKAEPGLNAWFDGDKNIRMIHKNMHVGMAVDTPDGLFVAALRNVNQASREQLRQEINRLRDNTANRSIPPEDLKDYTIVLSNFGKFAGRYATPVVTPPCVAIVAAGALRHEVVPVLGGVEVHRIIPISLTFDHRACTGGEAARFLKAMLDDLGKAE